MRRLISFLLALVFMLHTSLVVATPACAHCPEMDCPASQCVDLGCLPSVMPGAPSVAALPGLPPAVALVPFYANVELPVPLHEIWTPPD